MLISVNGQWIGSDLEQIEVTNPFDGSYIDSVPDAGDAIVDTAIRSARSGLELWGGLSQNERNTIMYRFTEILEANRHQVAESLTKETGKTLKEAEAEVDVCKAVTRAYCERAAHLYGNCMPGGSTLGRTEADIVFTRREPLGVITCLMPFNYPVDLFGQKVSSALSVGNAVILKPPTDNPLTIITLVKYMHEAGVPERALQVITGRGSRIGPLLVSSPLIDAVTMTGSTEAGIDIYKRAASNLTRVFLELGGNDAFVVMEDADLDLAVQEAVGSRMGNAGQICCASKRFIVHRSVADTFCEKLINALKQLKIGDPTDPSTDVGCLISRKAALNVEKQVMECISEGAHCVLGGKSFGNACFEPTVLRDVTANMGVARDIEIFGPVFPIIEYDTVDEALAICNASCYGLSGSVFSKNVNRAITFASKTQTAGNVINGGSAYRTADLAFGGYKKSGIGREGASRTLEELTQEKNYILKNALNA